MLNRDILCLTSSIEPTSEALNCTFPGRWGWRAKSFVLPFVAVRYSSMQVAHWFVINAQVCNYPPGNPVWGSAKLDGPGMSVVQVGAGRLKRGEFNHVK